MPIQHHRLIPRYTRWRLLEDGVLAEECLWNNTVGSGTVSFSGVVETFFSSQKTRNDGFSLLPTASFHNSWAACLCSSTRGRSVPTSPHAYEFSGWYSTSKEKSWAPSPLPPNWVEGSFPSQAGELPPTAVHSGKGCGSSLLFFFPRCGSRTIHNPRAAFLMKQRKAVQLWEWEWSQ